MTSRDSMAPLFSVRGLALIRQAPERPPLQINHVHLTLESGQLVLLQGVSGQGKSSLLMALARLIPSNAEEMRLGGVPAGEFSPPRWRAAVHLVAAEAVMVEGEVRANLLLPWQFRGMREIPQPTEEVLRERMDGLGLEEIPLGARASALSSGQRERVALLRGLLFEPRVLLLDEPTANLDGATSQRVWRELEAYRARTGCAMFCVTHGKAGQGVQRVLSLHREGLREEGERR